MGTSLALVLSSIAVPRNLARWLINYQEKALLSVTPTMEYRRNPSVSRHAPFANAQNLAGRVGAMATTRVSNVS